MFVVSVAASVSWCECLCGARKKKKRTLLRGMPYNFRKTVIGEEGSGFQDGGQRLT